MAPSPNSIFPPPPQPARLTRRKTRPEMPRPATAKLPSPARSRWERKPQGGPQGSAGRSTRRASLLDHATWLEGRLSDKFYGGEDNPAEPVGNHVEKLLTRHARLVLQRWCHCLRLHIVVARCRPGGRPGVGLHHHGFLRHVLSNIDQAGAEELPRRYYQRNGPQEARYGQRVLLNGSTPSWPSSGPSTSPFSPRPSSTRSIRFLSSATPAFLDSLELKTFTMGNKPPGWST